MPFARLAWTTLVLYGVTLCYKKDGKCYKSMDLLITLDVSGSIEPESWQSEINVSKQIIQSLAVPQSGNSFAIMDFSTEPNIIFNLDQNAEKAVGALNELKSNFKDGHSFIDLALHAASSILSSTKSRNPLKTFVIITDGYMTLKDGKNDTYFLSPAKKKLSDANVNVFAVGIGKFINEDALKLIASRQSHVFNVSDGSTLLQQVQKLAEIPCPGAKDSPGQTEESDTLKCDKIRFKRVGCYRDGQVKPRPLPHLILTDRDPSSKVYSGQTINWKQWDTYLPHLVCRCAEKSAKKGMVIFGLQYYGECWSNTKADTFNKDGPAKLNSSCVTLGFKPCGEAARYCVGESEHNYVYKIVEKINVLKRRMKRDLRSPVLHVS